MLAIAIQIVNLQLLTYTTLEKLIIIIVVPKLYIAPTSKDESLLINSLLFGKESRGQTFIWMSIPKKIELTINLW